MESYYTTQRPHQSHGRCHPRERFRLEQLHAPNDISSVRNGEQWGLSQRRPAMVRPLSDISR